MRHGFGFLCVATLIATLCACAAPADRLHERLPRLDDLNILMVVLDTVGADDLGCYGSAVGQTPTLDRLAAEGVLFRRAYAPAPWTQPSIASLFTSKMPSSHGLVHLFGSIGDEHDTIAELLARRGFDTAAVVSHSLLREQHGFAQGFATFDDSSVGGHFAVSGHRVTDRAIEWLDRRESVAPFFLLAHYFDPHFVYHDHPDYDLTAGYSGALRGGMDIWELRNARASLSEQDIDYVRGLYHEEVAYTDAQLGRLLEHLRGLPLERDTLVVVVGDHGEEIMEHGWIGHTRSLYDELIHVPMLFSLPGILEPHSVDGAVSLLDVAPTLLALAGETFPGDAAEGVSLIDPLLGIEDGLAERTLFGEVSFALGDWSLERDRLKVSFKTALVKGPLKLVHDLETDRWSLYDRDADPAEQRDVYPTHPEGTALRSRLSRWEEARAQQGGAESLPEIDPEELERLRSLGYVQ